MGMVVQHNMNALNAYNKLNTNVAGLKKSSEKLASGYRINRAGDDAAGLAISEKMRSQIKGLNQAVRNSQDGINMIQTYEGAAQESHNILRRMKELASEAANGTYQNEVDRDAVQLEFNQLNDELNQIADTDFNGVVMLNGGQMADGTKAVNGKFDYASGEAKAARQLTKSDINIVGDQLWDNNANAAWTKLNAAWTRTAGQPATNGPDKVDLTFKYNSADNTWSCIEATNGAAVSSVKTTNTSNGGFTIKADTTEMANVVVDQTKLANGDTITLTFNNPANAIRTYTNASATNTGTDNFSKGTQGITDAKSADLTVTKGTAVTDANMTADDKALFDLLNGATVTASYTDKAQAAGDLKIVLSNGVEIKNTADYTLNVGGTAYVFEATDGKTIDVKNGAGDSIIKFVAAAQTTVTDAADPTKKNATGSISYTIGLEAYNYDKAAVPTVEVNATGNVSVADNNRAAIAPLTYTDHLVLQTGARTKDSVDFTMNYATDGMGQLKANLNISSRADGLNTASLSLNTQEDANYAIDRIDNAINKVSMVRATFGATQNRLEHKIDNLTTTAENIQEAESSIRDTDMASEMMNYTKFNILQQAAQSMLAQANQQPQSILQLLG